MAAKVEAAIRAPRRREERPPLGRNRWAYLFISPFYILFLIFGLFPVLFSIYLSLHDWNGVGPLKFAGLENFSNIFQAGGKPFWLSIQNGILFFFMYVPIMTFLAIVLAVVLNSRKVRFFQGFRVMIFAPYVTSMVAAGFTFRLLYDVKGGLFNIILRAIGLPGLSWLDDRWWARIGLCLLVVWGWLGYNMVIMLAGLQTIPKELTEAALIDGATPVQAFFRITIPLLRPVIIFSVTLSIIGSFGLFNEIMALTRSTAGPMRATLTPMVYIYQAAFRDHDFGRASASAYVYFALVFAFSYLYNRFYGRER